MTQQLDTHQITVRSLQQSSLPVESATNIALASTDSSHLSTKILILEQPSSYMRFRYESEGIYPIQGISSTPIKRTFPTIQIVNFDKLASVVVSCVTKDQPYRPHPHCLAGDDCKWGIYQKQVHSNIISFEKLGIQFTKRKEIEKVIQTRQEKKLDPFQTGFHHVKQLDLDLDVIRLCFQVFIISKTENKWKQMDVVVSEPIFNKKGSANLSIINLSHYSASVDGGKKILMFCEKVMKDDVEIRFFEQKGPTNSVEWEAFGLFRPSDVHKGFGIAFSTPPYKTLNMETSIDVFIQLRRPSDNAVSNNVPFLFLPSPNLSFKQKKRRYAENSETDETLQSLQGIVKEDLFRQAESFPVSSLLQNTGHVSLNAMPDLTAPCLPSARFARCNCFKHHPIPCNQVFAMPIQQEEDHFRRMSGDRPDTNNVVAQLYDSRTAASSNYHGPLASETLQIAQACDSIVCNTTSNSFLSQNRSLDECSVIDDLSGLLEELGR